MIRLLLAGFAFSCLALSLGGCSAESKSESCTFNGREVPCNQMPDSNGNVSGKPVVEDLAFKCGTQSCQSGTNYCQQYGRFDGSLNDIRISSSTCKAKPMECNDCDCLEEYVKKHDCTGYNSFMCQSSRSQVMLTCLN